MRVRVHNCLLAGQDLELAPVSIKHIGGRRHDLQPVDTAFPADDERWPFARMHAAAPLLAACPRDQR
jgi:hypothetical protein